MSAGDVGRLVLLAAVWGLAFVFIRVAVMPLGPVALVELRQGARLEIASQESTIRKLSRPQLDAALQRVARR